MRRSRRRFLSFLPALCLGTPAHALLACMPVGNGVEYCEAGIQSDIATRTARGQQMSQWCWAACLQMVFAYWGRDITQERIVIETFGRAVGQPARAQELHAALNRVWTDDQGHTFTVRGDLASANAMTAAQDLAQGMPLIVGTLGHAVVLTSLVYFRDPMGNGSVQSAVVRDPWPGRGRRILTPEEWYAISFASRIRLA